MVSRSIPYDSATARCNGFHRAYVIAEGINRVVQQNPREVFLIEGHTDAVGTDVDNLSLSDRRAEWVALVLTQEFGVPAESVRRDPANSE